MRFSGSLSLIPLFFAASLSFVDALVVHRNNSKTLKHFSSDAPSCNGSPANCGLHLMQGYVFPGTHNTGTSTLDPNPALAAVSALRPIYCTTECQNYEIQQQLANGIRAFHFELCDAQDAKSGAFFDLFQMKFANPVPAYTANDPVICHGTNPFWGYGPLLSIVFQDIQEVLSQSNNQIIRIVLEFRQGNTKSMLDRTVELFTSTFCNGDASCPVAIQFSELYNKNPTLGSLTANVTNRILFTNPALTYYPTDGTLPAPSSSHYSVPWVLQDYIACNYSSASDINTVLDQQLWECKTDAAASLCTYYTGQDQIIYQHPVPWKIQGQIGFAVQKEECIGTYAKSMNMNDGIVASVITCQQNKINAGQVEVDYFDGWNGLADLSAYVRWINTLNYNTSIGAPWGDVY